MKVPVVDNGGQWTHREWRVLRDLGAETRIVPNTTPLGELDADGIVLSGGALSLEGTDAKLGVVGSYLDEGNVPVLAICVGHQFLARHFGGKVSRASTPEFGRVELTVDAPTSPIFRTIPSSLRVWASHSDEVSELPPDFEVLAHSPSCKVEAMAHRTRPVFGLQFHPEVEHTEKGTAFFQNFLSLCHR
ncbi:MAG: GMP synthase subunit A [Euryarchaeota archaeon]|nr:GMP synthase subunit A [Euryarchaeota archaeon]MDE1837806.1 GMP synthase subunit A [Euryarchaeota archaeon]MDE1880357.1 GMP synthase subunit A [Euryarchaeota archaeon]MDE2046190.1 GMP synthase subunit A [Thermoplasmata archaeon]